MPIYTLGDVTPTLGKEVFVAPNASVIGDVVLGDSSSIWFGVVVRGDRYPIRVGARSNIQDNSVVHITGGQSATTIGDDVTVGHAVIVHGCTIGNRCLVGMGSIVLDDAVLGDECFVAAGSLVPPRMVVPARSFLIGRPAKVIRQVRDEELAQIQGAADHYVENAADFLRTLR